jgi:hypothetical protein
MDLLDLGLILLFYATAPGPTAARAAADDDDDDDDDDVETTAHGTPVLRLDTAIRSLAAVYFPAACILATLLPCVVFAGTPAVSLAAASTQPPPMAL